MIEGFHDPVSIACFSIFTTRINKLERVDFTRLHLVLDGCKLPAKAPTDNARSAKVSAALAQINAMKKSIPDLSIRRKDATYIKLCK
jgi:hypothetical protein